VRTDDSGKWYDNALRFPTELEAARYARDLSYRWSAVREHRAIECDDAVTHAYIDGRAVEIEE
jgi:hypothetical protein